MSCSTCPAKAILNKSDIETEADSACGKLNSYDWLEGIPDTEDKTHLVEVRFKNTHKDFFVNEKRKIYTNVHTRINIWVIRVQIRDIRDKQKTRIVEAPFAPYSLAEQLEFPNLLQDAALDLLFFPRGLS